MLLLSKHTPNYGNLMSYKNYIRPAAHNLYGHSGMSMTKHQKNIHHVLYLLFVYGACTTWDMAKIHHRKTEAIRENERIYRRLFIGRYDGKRHTDGIVDIGLVVREEKKVGGKRSWLYRLSLHGILYCMDALKINDADIDRMASKYADSLPRIFGRWGELKSVLGCDAYKLKVLSKALFADGSTTQNTPISELMSFIHVKYGKNYEVISEHDLAEQVSYWFYTYLQYYRHPKSGKIPQRVASVKKLFKENPQLHGWYKTFFRETKTHYQNRLRAINSAANP